jgi:hypothetical protein
VTTEPQHGASERCGAEYGENVAYWPCTLPKGHDGPHVWDAYNRLRWERDTARAELAALRGDS